MAILENLLEEIERLNANLKVLNTELATVDSSAKKGTLKEKPLEKEPIDVEVKSEPSKEFTKDYVLSVGKEFLKTADPSDKKAFKDKLSELEADKLSTLDVNHYQEIVNFMKARINA